MARPHPYPAAVAVDAGAAGELGGDPYGVNLTVITSPSAMT
jgi:hypothetical protein